MNRDQIRVGLSATLVPAREASTRKRKLARFVATVKGPQTALFASANPMATGGRVPGARRPPGAFRLQLDRFDLGHEPASVITQEGGHYSEHGIAESADVQDVAPLG